MRRRGRDRERGDFATGRVTLLSRDPVEIRSAFLRSLCLAAECAGGTTYGLVAGASGPRVSRFEVEGEPILRKSMELLTADSSDWPKESVGSFLSPPPSHTRAFIALEDIMPRREFEASRRYERVYRPFGLTDQTRLLVFQGRRFISNVCLIRRGGRNFHKSELRRLRRYVPSTIATLLGADALEEVPGRAYLVARPDGTIEYASAEASRWLDRDGFSSALRASVRAFDCGGDAERSVPLLAASARLVRLDHPLPVRYLVCVEPAAPLTTTPTCGLSLAQRKIAEFAASGATITEIAAAVERSENTVKAHLREVYRRLGVASRVELARALDDA